MAKNPIGNQIDAINRYSPFSQLSLDLKKIDQQAVSAGIEFTHWKAMPSPLGLKDRGDYRRSDGVDQISSNGMLYTCSGKFTATMVGNDQSAKWSDGGESDPSMARLIMPRFYNATNDGEQSNGNRIRMAPGDRVYVADPTADVLVTTYHKMDYDPQGDNVPMFPIEKIENLIDSRNISYICNVDFQIVNGNIRWIAGGKNPGIDQDTGKGRVYSVRYLYRAYYYVTALPKEIRVTAVTTNGVRTNERLPYHASIVREYIYHNENRGDKQNALKSPDPARAVNAPIENNNPNKSVVNVEMANITND